MATLTIGDHSVNVDDSFLKLSVADQQKAVDEIAAHLAPPDPTTVNNVVRSAATGVPIVGGLLNKADAATNATLAPVLNGLFDEKDQLKGNWSERYAKSLEEQNKADANFAEQHPVVDTGAKIAGGVAAMAPAVAAAPGLFGATGGLGRQVLQGGLSNAVLGGADAATRNGDVIGGAITGGALGAAAPVASKVVGAVASPFISNIMARLDPEGYAARQVARGIAESGQSTGDIANAVQQATNEGQGVFNVADAMGNSGQRLLSSVARAAGPGRTDTVNALEARQAGQGRRVANALSEGFGTPQTAEQTRTAMTDARTAAADAEYGAVREDAQPVDVQNVIDHIDANVPAEPAAPDSTSGRLQRYRRMLTNGDEENPQNLTDFEHVQRVRSELSDEIQTARQAGQNNRARLLNQVLTRLDTSLENSSEGFRAANANFAQASRNIEAIDTGRAAALRGRAEDTIPAFQALTPEGQQAWRAGYADPLIEAAQGPAQGVNKARPLTGDAFRDEAAAAAPGNDLMQRRIGRENTMFETRNTALGGSKTADNLADAHTLGIDPSVVGHILTGNWGGALRHLALTASNGFNGNTPAVRQAVARILLRHGANVTPAALDAMVGQTVARIQMLQRLAQNATRVASGTAAVASNAKTSRPPIFVQR
jgi:hypothetical protein